MEWTEGLLFPWEHLIKLIREQASESKMIEETYNKV